MSTMTDELQFFEGSILVVKWQAVKTCKITLKLVS